MIAHRLSTVRTADQIIVLENGRIVQRGNHKELMREDGLYRRFVGNAQPSNRLDTERRESTWIEG